MKDNMKKNILRLGGQFIRFGLVGAINTILNLVIYWTCVGVGIHYLLANTISFLLVVALSYVLNNLFTFRDKRKKPDWSVRTLLKVYASYFFTGMVINSVLLWFWNDIVKINENISPVLNLAVTIPLNFILNRRIFCKKE